MTHEIDYRILGDDMQVVEIELDQGETVIAGAMNYMGGSSSRPRWVPGATSGKASGTWHWVLERGF